MNDRKPLPVPVAMLKAPEVVVPLTLPWVVYFRYVLRSPE